MRCDVHKHLSPLISAFREHYNTQYVMVDMIKTWGKKVD